ncbi:hypothetical protein [Romboutsia faecis]|nr:hypothetical protein [Romboutsia faecis]
MINMIILLYGGFLLFLLVFGIIKIIERIKEKPKDDKDLDKYKKY